MRLYGNAVFFLTLTFLIVLIGFVFHMFITFKCLSHLVSMCDFISTYCLWYDVRIFMLIYFNYIYNIINFYELVISKVWTSKYTIHHFHIRFQGLFLSIWLFYYYIFPHLPNFQIWFIWSNDHRIWFISMILYPVFVFRYDIRIFMIIDYS